MNNSPCKWVEEEGASKVIGGYLHGSTLAACFIHHEEGRWRLEILETAERGEIYDSLNAAKDAANKWFEEN